MVWEQHEFIVTSEGPLHFYLWPTATCGQLEGVKIVRCHGDGLHRHEVSLSQIVDEYRSQASLGFSLHGIYLLKRLPLVGRMQYKVRPLFGQCMLCECTVDVGSILVA